MALKYYDKVLEIEPENVYALYGKGNVLVNQQIDEKGFVIKQQKISEAIPYYDKVLEIEPENVNYLYGKAVALDNLGITLNSLGKHKEAIKYFDKALEIYPKYININILNSKAFALANLGKNEEALPALLS